MDYYKKFKNLIFYMASLYRFSLELCVGLIFEPIDINGFLSSSF